MAGVVFESTKLANARGWLSNRINDCFSYNSKSSYTFNAEKVNRNSAEFVNFVNDVKRVGGSVSYSGDSIKVEYRSTTNHLLRKNSVEEVKKVYVNDDLSTTKNVGKLEKQRDEITQKCSNAFQEFREWLNNCKRESQNRDVVSQITIVLRNTNNSTFNSINDMQKATLGSLLKVTNEKGNKVVNFIFDSSLARRLEAGRITSGYLDTNGVFHSGKVKSNEILPGFCAGHLIETWRDVERLRIKLYDKKRESKNFVGGYLDSNGKYLVGGIKPGDKLPAFCDGHTVYTWDGVNTLYEQLKKDKFKEYSKESKGKIDKSIKQTDEEKVKEKRKKYEKLGQWYVDKNGIKHFGPILNGELLPSFCSGHLIKNWGDVRRLEEKLKQKLEDDAKEKEDKRKEEAAARRKEKQNKEYEKLGQWYVNKNGIKLVGPILSGDLLPNFCSGHIIKNWGDVRRLEEKLKQNKTFTVQEKGNRPAEPIKSPKAKNKPAEPIKVPNEKNKEYEKLGQWYIDEKGVKHVGQVSPKEYLPNFCSGHLIRNWGDVRRLDPNSKQKEEAPEFEL